MRRNAFTLVELLVVIAVIGVLFALIAPAIHAAFSGQEPTEPKVTESAPYVTQESRDALVYDQSTRLEAQPQIETGRYLVDIQGYTYEIIYRSRDEVSIRCISQ